jgi:hypothetical protein
MITLDVIDRLIRGKLGTFDLPCPLCGPDRRSPANRRRPVLRVWRLDQGFAGFHCARCGEKGHTRDGSAPPPDPAKLARARAEAAQREKLGRKERRRVALWLWHRRRPIAGSIAEIYLCEVRHCGGPLPATLGFLPAYAEYPPAMIAAFGVADEPEPGAIAIGDEAVRGVHLTKLKVDGSGKAEVEPNKIMIGDSVGVPIVLAPSNDLLGLAITEGIENALSVYEATGLGSWAAGSASRLPALAAAIPHHVECVTLLVDDDDAGRRHASRLVELVAARGIEVRSVVPNRAWKVAA